MGFKLTWNLKRNTLRLDPMSAYNHLSLVTSQRVPVSLWRNANMSSNEMSAQTLIPDRVVRIGDRSWGITPSEHIKIRAGNQNLFLLIITEKKDLFIWAPTEGDWWTAVLFGISPHIDTALEYGKSLVLPEPSPLIQECPHCEDDAFPEQERTLGDMPSYVVS